MNTVFKCVFFSSIIFAAGCATKPSMTREEFLAATTRTYDKSPDEILNSAQKLLQLADGDDFNFSHSEDGLDASRNWMIYLVFSAAFGNDVWQVKTAKQPDGKTKVFVSASTNPGSTLAPLGTGVGTVPGTAGNTVQGTALYDLFYSRLEYLLGINKEWMTCRDSEQKLKAKQVWGLNEALCSVTTKDIDPRTGISSYTTNRKNSPAEPHR